jgi:hypothetical protein
MSEPIRHWVHREWTAEMTAAVYQFAAEMSDDPERQATIVGMVHIVWPRLLDASSLTFRAETP